MSLTGVLAKAQSTNTTTAQQHFFANCFNEFFKEVYSIARYYHPHQADDIVSEVFLKIQQKGVRYLHAQNLRGLFITATHNLCKNYYRKKQTTELVDERNYAPLTKVDYSMDFESALQTLREEQRHAICWLLQGYQQKEIAEKLGKKLSATKMLILRAKQQLKKFFLEAA